MNGELGQFLMIELSTPARNPALERVLSRFQPSGFAFRRLEPGAAAADALRSCSRGLEFRPFLAAGECALRPGSPFRLLVDTPGATPGEAERAGDLTGSVLEHLGLNLDLGLLLDLPAPAGSAAPSAGSLAACAEAYVKGLNRHSILACGRRFPASPPQSKGSSAAPQPVGKPISKTMTELWREDLVPYRRLGTKLAMVEISPAVHKAYDYEFPRPASLSTNVVEGLLRAKLGYTGVALAEVAAAARAAGIDSGEAAIRALAAGCDLLLVPGEPDETELVLGHVRRALELGRLTQARLEQALQRVRSARSGLRQPAKLPAGAALDRSIRNLEEFARELGARERTHA